MKKLKVALVLDDSLDKVDGVQQYVLTVGRWLVAQGHEVHYIVGETTRTDLPNVHSMTRNVKVRFNGNRMAIPLPTSRRKIRELLAREQFDVLHVQAPYSPQLAARVIKAALPNTAVIGTFHIIAISWFVNVANHLLGFWVRRSVRRFNAVLAVSEAARLFAAKAYKMNCIVVPNTLDLTPFFAGKPFKQYEQVPTIVFLGRLVERKGCQYLLRAIVELRKIHDTPFKVVICGRGHLEKTLQSFVRSHNLEGVVEFEGFIDEADKPHYLASADIVAYPSTGGESFGIVILEAMAASRGVVLAGNNPGYASVLVDRPQALFDPKNSETFAGLLKHHLEDAAGRQAARQWQQLFVKNFDVSIVGQEIVAQYNKALRNKPEVR